MKKEFITILFLLSIWFTSEAQVTLVADGPGETYELINSVLAPEYNVIEVPDCEHDSFGRHIEEVFDDELDKHVFLFHIHTAEDNDRCINFDRQRNEIKTYDKSPDNLKGILGEKVEYKWKFKLDANFQASSRFTHLHQIKAVGGSESSQPLITLTARKGSPDQLELRHAATTSQITLFKTDLAPFKGTWVEAKETISYGEAGQGEYDIVITTVSGADTLFNYSSNTIRLWKTDAEFQRPKWGIYRSIVEAQDLRDEQVLFADFSIEEINNTSTPLTEFHLDPTEIHLYPNPVSDDLRFSETILNTFMSVDIFDINGKQVFTKNRLSETLSVEHLKAGIYILRFRNETIRSQGLRVMVY